MNNSWITSVFPIAAIFSFRMLGLFMLIPVFTVFAGQLEGATPALMGIALGSYGLSQGLLQMPFGLLSDRWGRKPVLTLGLCLFIAGSVLGALTSTIHGMIAARILQGTGAIGSVLIALLADLTPDDQRTKAMAVIGMTIGTSFSLAMILSPAITHHYGLPGIFYLTALLAFTGLVLLHGVIPTPARERFHHDSETSPSLLKTVFFNPQLQRLNAGIFLQHFILTATFYAVPILLKHQVKSDHFTQAWQFYLPLMIIAFIAMVPFIILAEKKRQMKAVFLASVATSGIAQFLLAIGGYYWLSLWIFMLLYFTAFNILEAVLPSLISRQADPHSKGTAMGIYSSSQFLGIFAGGTTAGVLYQYAGNQALFYVNAVLCIVWLFIARTMKPNRYYSTVIINCESYAPETLITALPQLQQLPGVKEAIFEPDENVLYLRVDKQDYQSTRVEDFLAAHPAPSSIKIK
ncbi:MFS transporter [Legionella taurinensis]|uniref:MFS transporter n=1 Tax=Legionella taurinensis TaxID=70611 RepID=A0A3A5L562_9GAMM|nr:MFS transporter [Legionella taurinensis]MDX1838465.1 MFS transporter [Legionella taurinensis]PUT38908.1 MFS transporter [Legionella taurinensis]PUT40969.1 MFS transporter [Legionella taurinensis]PUT43201.1 MFS transporter [Legionella taurinensis]PUT46387.1 MFS transporter [Legionella taurinensis]